MAKGQTTTNAAAANAPAATTATTTPETTAPVTEGQAAEGADEGEEEVEGERQPVTARGKDLLALIAAEDSEEGEGDEATLVPGFLYLTQAEAAEGVAAGHLQADLTNIQGEGENATAAVYLTEAGRAAFTSSGAQPTTTGITVQSGIPMPTFRARKVNGDTYPFATMNVGDSFHVPKTADNEDPANRLASSVSMARTRFSVDDPSGATETVKVRYYKRVKDASGKEVYAKDANDRRILDREETKTRVKQLLTRDFAVKSVGKDDPNGEGARVWRTK
jgi:hypothetical protein